MPLDGVIAANGCECAVFLMYDALHEHVMRGSLERR